MKPLWLEPLLSKETLRQQQQQPVKANSGMPLGTVTQEEKKDVFNLPGNDQYRIKSDLEF